jgi:hypothetical protein
MRVNHGLANLVIVAGFLSIGIAFSIAIFVDAGVTLLGIVWHWRRHGTVFSQLSQGEDHHVDALQRTIVTRFCLGR